MGYRFIWDLKIPLKIKIFIWLVLRNIILTKDNLLSRDGLEMPSATSVLVLRPLITLCLHVLLPDLFGKSWDVLWGLGGSLILLKVCSELGVHPSLLSNVSWH